mgnify:FL=1
MFAIADYGTQQESVLSLSLEIPYFPTTYHIIKINTKQSTSNFSDMQQYIKKMLK